MAHGVGFNDRTSFTRAFRAQLGLSARDFVHTLSRRAMPTPTGRQLAHLLHAIEGAAPEQPPPVPPEATNERWTVPHAHGFHLAIWMYRGSGDLLIDGTAQRRRTGDAHWIPAGTVHQHRTAADSIGFPLGTMNVDEFPVAHAFSTRFSPAWDGYLLSQVVGTHSLLRPVTGGHHSLHNIFPEQLAEFDGHAMPMPTDPAARRLARTFLRSMRAIPSCTADPADLIAFRIDTGMSFRQWQHTARMRVARDLLAAGATPSSTARRTGYTQLANFSRAFRSFHGVPPSTYHRTSPDARIPDAAGPAGGPG